MQARSSWQGFLPLFRPAILLAVFACSLSALTATIPDYGITWDEAETNFPAARRQAEWFRRFASGVEVLNEAGVRQYFETESDHPSLPRTLMALSRLALPSSVTDRCAFAFSTGVLVSAFTAFFLGLLWKQTSLLWAVYGTLVLVLHPHWFGHSHFAEYDIIVAIAWFFAAVTFYWAHTENGASAPKFLGPWTRSGLAAGALGLAISVKVHAMFLPFPLLAWAILHRRWQCWRWCLLCLPVVPLIYVGTQPYLWWDTLGRILTRFQDYGAKVPIHVFYLGHLYPGDVPWHYPWVMLLATLPVGITIPLLLWALRHRQPAAGNTGDGVPSTAGWTAFLLLQAVTLPLLFSFKSAYDGIRFFLPALPFLCLLGVGGLQHARAVLSSFWGARTGGRVLRGACTLLLAIQLHTCWRVHPFQLAYYSFLVGGVRGAAGLGLESTYWCDAVTPQFIKALADRIPPAARVATHAMDAPTLIEFQRMGLVPEGWKFIKEGPADCRILQFRQGFFGPVEIRLASERTPITETALDGVPLIRAYAGP